MTPKSHWRRNQGLTAALLLLWLVVSFVVPFFARELDAVFFGWPFAFWMAAQGALIVYVLIVGVYAYVMNRWDKRLDGASPQADP